MYTERSKTGFTIVELYVSLSVLVILIASISSIYIVGSRMFNGGLDRIIIRNEGASAMELAKIHLVHANTIDEITASSITFAADMGSGNESYRLYLFNEDDPAPSPPYSESQYQLRLAEGDTSYGQGKVLARDIEPSIDPLFSQNNNLITLDWTLNKEDALIRLRTNVRPRNL